MKKILLITLASSFATLVNAGDVAAGKAKSAVCASCHGAEGISAIPLYPNIAGQQEAYLVKSIKEYKTGDRKEPTMGAMAKPLSDEDIDNLAAYYTSLGKK